MPRESGGLSPQSPSDSGAVIIVSLGADDETAAQRPEDVQAVAAVAPTTVTRPLLPEIPTGGNWGQWLEPLWPHLPGEQPCGHLRSSKTEL